MLPGASTSSPVNGPGARGHSGQLRRRGGVTSSSQETRRLVDRACRAAEDAFRSFGHSGREERSTFLHTIADEIEARAEDITRMGDTGVRIAGGQASRRAQPYHRSVAAVCGAYPVGQPSGQAARYGFFPTDSRLPVPTSKWFSARSDRSPFSGPPTFRWRFRQREGTLPLPWRRAARSLSRGIRPIPAPVR